MFVGTDGGDVGPDGLLVPLVPREAAGALVLVLRVRLALRLRAALLALRRHGLVVLEYNYSLMRRLFVRIYLTTWVY